MLYTIATKLSRLAFVALEPHARLINWPMYMYKQIYYFTYIYYLIADMAGREVTTKF